MYDTLSLFDLLTNDDVDWLFQIAQERTYPADHVLVQEGEDPAELFIILNGVANIELAALGGASVASLGAGALVGELSFLDDLPAAGTVRLAEKSQLMVIPKSNINERLDSDEAFAGRFYKSLGALTSRRLRERMVTLINWIDQKPELNTGIYSGGWSTLEHSLTELKRVVYDAQKISIENDKSVLESTARRLVAQFGGFLLTTSQVLGEKSRETEESKEVFGGQLQKLFMPYAKMSRFAERCLSKPRGYAGDFMTIEWMYENDSDGEGVAGKLLDAAILNSPPCQAVRNRRVILNNEIRDIVQSKEGEVVKIASFACGPAAELLDIYEEVDSPEKIQATLVDIDTEALAFVEKRIADKGLTPYVTLAQANLVYLANGRQKLNIENLDLVYSIGLIDYFEDKFVIALLNYAYELLVPGGKVVLGNFHSDSTAKAFMDYVLDWRLIHRSEEDMNRIYAASKFSKPCTRIIYEDEGINMFAECIK